jgi:uncharacterized membrane protein YqaE (UPF0057 family)
VKDHDAGTRAFVGGTVTPPFANAAFSERTVIAPENGAITVIDAVPDTAGAATDVAVTVTVCAVAGAVSTPVALILPPLAVHVTAWFADAGTTTEEQLEVPPVVTDVGAQVTTTLVGSGNATTTVAVPDTAGAATDVAVTVTVCAVAGAVSTPAALMLPALAVHVTAWFAGAGVMTAEQLEMPLIVTEVGVQLTAILVGSGGGNTVTATDAVPDIAGAATDVAVTVTVCAVAGAVSTPAALILPALAVHVTAWFAPAGEITAEQFEVFPVVTDVGAQVTAILVGSGAVTATDAAPDFVGSCTDVAVTVTVCAVAGAVNTPAALILPALAVHVTAWFAPAGEITAEQFEAPPVVTLAGLQVTVTPVMGGGVTVKLALAVVVGGSGLQLTYVYEGTQLGVMLKVNVYVPGASVETLIAVGELILHVFGIAEVAHGKEYDTVGLGLLIIAIFPGVPLSTVAPEELVIV